MAAEIALVPADVRVSLDVESISVPDWMRAHPPRTCPATDVPRPVQLGSWNKLSGRQWSYGSVAGPPKLILPSLPCDLNVGLEDFVPRAGPGNPGVEVVVRAMLAGGAPLANCDVVSFRNNLNKILSTLHDPRTSWAVDCCLPAAGGGLFLEVVDTVEEWVGSVAEQEKYVAWGYNFEARCSGRASADANTEYGALVHTRLGPHRLYLGAEIDCYDPAGCPPGAAPPLSSFREIKTYKPPQHAGQWRTLYRHKHPKWWIQSFLGGVEALVLGARDEEGMVQRIDVVRTADLPRLSWNNGERWSPEQTLAWGADCLGWMRAAARQHPGRHLRFSYAPSTGEVFAQLMPDGDLPARLAAVLPPVQDSPT